MSSVEYVILMCTMKNQTYRVSHAFASELTEENYPSAQRVKTYTNTTWTIAMNNALNAALTAAGAFGIYGLITIAKVSTSATGAPIVTQLITESQLISILTQVITAGPIVAAQVPLVVTSPGSIVVMRAQDGMSYRLSRVAAVNLTEEKYPLADRVMVMPDGSWTTAMNMALYKAVVATGSATMSFWTITTKPSVADPTKPALGVDQLVSILKGVMDGTVV